MKLIINEKSDKPIYLQIEEQLSGQIISKELPAHYCLPSIRKIALELRVSVITVKKAYDDLEQQGLIYTMAGKGCFVSELDHSDVQDKINTILKNHFLEDIKYAKESGITLEELINYIKNNY